MESPPALNPAVLTAAFDLVFRKGRSPPSCPMPDDNDLLNRILDAVPSASPKACRQALIKVRRLSFDVMEVCSAFRQGDYGAGDTSKAGALADLGEKNPGFLKDEYLTAFAVGLMWAGLE